MTDDPRSTWEQSGGDRAVGEGADPPVPVDEDAIRVLVERLSRPHPSGGAVIERAAILAAGADSAAMLAWVIAHDGHAEEPDAPRASRGLHGRSSAGASSPAPRQPLRYVLPAGAL
jgi:hypothetical protein